MNNASNWGIDLDYFNSFPNNTMGDFKVQRDIYRDFYNKTLELWNLQDQGTITIEEFFNSKFITLFENIANTVIAAFVALPKLKILKQIKFEWLKDETIAELRVAVCLAIQHLAQNKSLSEKLYSSTLSASSYSITTETISWLNSNDIIGNFARNAVKNSKISNYRLVEEDNLTFFMSTENGNWEAIGVADFSNIPELI